MRGQSLLCCNMPNYFVIVARGHEHLDRDSPNIPSVLPSSLRHGRSLERLTDRSQLITYFKRSDPSLPSRRPSSARLSLKHPLRRLPHLHASLGFHPGTRPSLLVLYLVPVLLVRSHHRFRLAPDLRLFLASPPSPVSSNAPGPRVDRHIPAF